MLLMRRVEQKGTMRRSIGYFGVVLLLSFSSKRVLVHSLLKMSFQSHANKTHLHMKGCAPGLALKKRHKTTPKWSILLSTKRGGAGGGYGKTRVVTYKKP